MPKVSVIIPTYNSAKYLPKAIDSVLTQTYQDFEIIIVDDGSTDNTDKLIPEYIKKYPDKIKYYYQENAGPGAARNKGIVEANGDYIAFLDADDMWLSEKLENQIRLFEKDKDLALVFTDMQQKHMGKILYPSYIKKWGYDSLISDTNLFQGLCHKVFILTPTVMLRKEILNEAGIFNEKYKIGEDYDLWLRIAKIFKVAYIDKPLAIRLIHDSNITNKNLLLYDEHIKLLKDFLKSGLFNKEQKKIFYKQLLEWYYKFGYYYFSKNKYKSSLKWFAKSFGCSMGIKPFFYFFIAVLPAKPLKLMRNFKQQLHAIWNEKNALWTEKKL